MAPRGLAVLIGAGPTSGAGIARVLANPQQGNLALALLARNADNLATLAANVKKSSGGILQPFVTDTDPENLRRTFKDIVNHPEFASLKLKLAIYHVNHSNRTPFLDQTAGAFTNSLQMYKTGSFAFAQEALGIIYDQNGGQTLSESWERGEKSVYKAYPNTSKLRNHIQIPCKEANLQEVT